MDAIRTGPSTPDSTKGRAVLTLRNPHVEALLVGLGIGTKQIQELRQFVQQLLSERNFWDIDRRKGGLFSPRRLSKADAHRAFDRAFGGEVQQ